MTLGRRCRRASCCHGPAELLQKQHPLAKLQMREGRGHSQGLLAHLGRLFWEETAEETYGSSLLQQLIKGRTQAAYAVF